MEERCENCEKIIHGTVYRTADDYELCSDCWITLKKEVVETVTST